MIAFLELMSPDYITRVSILGGEPLSKENLDDLKTLFTNIKQHYPKKEIWLYTGYIYENLKPKQKEVAQMADYVVDGPYIDEERDPKLQYRGSRNQRILKMNKNL
jgi:anaerobic ribonucleoside-triphosphate reductase activating protein